VKSTGNLRHHARICWTGEVVEAADATRDIKVARAALKGVKTCNGSITAVFQKVSQKGKPVYMCRQYTRNEAWYDWLIST